MSTFQLNIEDVIEVNTQKSGSRFDPSCVKALIQYTNNIMLTRPDPIVTKIYN